MNHPSKGRGLVSLMPEPSLSAAGALDFSPYMYAGSILNSGVLR